MYGVISVGYEAAMGQVPVQIVCEQNKQNWADDRALRYPAGHTLRNRKAREVVSEARGTSLQRATLFSTIEVFFWAQMKPRKKRSPWRQFSYQPKQ